MKIMEIIRAAEGGMKEHYITLVKGMAGRGAEVTALGEFSGESRAELLDAGVLVIPFFLPGRINPFTDCIRIIRIISLIRKTKPDIIHCHGFRAGFTGRLAGWISGVPMLYTVHNFTAYKRSKFEKWLIAAFEGWMGRKTDGIICVSRALKKNMLEEAGVRQEKLHVIYNSLPAWQAGDRKYVRVKYNIDENCILIGTASRLIPSKGTGILLRAAAGIIPIFPHVRLMITGTGPEESRLRDLADSLGIAPQTVFTGRVSNMQDYYAAFDLFVLPTLSEGLGMAVIEAMAAGLPVIATAVGGIPEWIVHERNGYLVRPDNVFDLRTALQSFLEEPEKFAQYGSQAKIDIQENGLTELEMVDKTLSVIRMACNKNQKRKKGNKL
jgi:glycosyltransferase involved in cell wall biosynthesis